MMYVSDIARAKKPTTATAAKIVTNIGDIIFYFINVKTLGLLCFFSANLYICRVICKCCSLSLDDGRI